jgi:tetraprenyl-beta-curcumene synthase
MYITIVGGGRHPRFKGQGMHRDVHNCGGDHIINAVLAQMTDPLDSLGSRLALGGAFADAARRYWLGVFPRVCRELSHWHDRADEIPDPVLRRLALEALDKRGNMEGAAGFATFVPHAQRPTVTRALVALQTSYNYLDMLAEQPHEDAIKSGHRLHEALLDALDPAASPQDYYAHYPRHEDNGYLQEMIEVCREALSTLPSYATVAAAGQRAAQRIVSFQSLNLSRSQGEDDHLAQWATEQTPPGSQLRWWETAGSGGSSMCVYALIAAAAEKELDPAEVEAIERAYFPWIGSLHSLLDSLVDSREDAVSEQRNLLDYYATSAQAAECMQDIAIQAMSSACALPHGRRHAIILAGMVGYYLSAPEASAAHVQPIAENVRATLGPLSKPTWLVFGARRLMGRLASILASPRAAFSARTKLPLPADRSSAATISKPDR